MPALPTRAGKRPFRRKPRKQAEKEAGPPRLPPHPPRRGRRYGARAPHSVLHAHHIRRAPAQEKGKRNGVPRPCGEAIEPSRRRGDERLSRPAGPGAVEIVVSAPPGVGSSGAAL